MCSTSKKQKQTNDKQPHKQTNNIHNWYAGAVWRGKGLGQVSPSWESAYSRHGSPAAKVNTGKHTGMTPFTEYGATPTLPFPRVPALITKATSTPPHPPSHPIPRPIRGSWHQVSTEAWNNDTHIVVWATPSSPRWCLEPSEGLATPRYAKLTPEPGFFASQQGDLLKRNKK